jgi:hypothetical protein
VNDTKAQMTHEAEAQTIRNIIASRKGLALDFVKAESLDSKNTYNALLPIAKSCAHDYFEILRQTLS